MAMTKRTAHMILIGFDIIALIAAIYVFNVFSILSTAIDVANNHIETQGNMGVYFLGLVVPLIHCYSIMGEKYPKLGMGLLAICGISIAALFIGASYMFEYKLSEADYVKCSAEHMTRSSFYLYAREEKLCD